MRSAIQDLEAAFRRCLARCECLAQAPPAVLHHPTTRPLTKPPMALTPATDEKIALGLAVLRDLARRGKIPPPPYSLAEIAEVCGVSPATIQSNKETMTSTPHQSKGRLVRFPGSSLAAQELGVSRGHLHRVLIGERQSAPLVARWQAWLKTHPHFAAIQPRR